MNKRSKLLAAVCVVFVGSHAFADVTGKIILQGDAPQMPVIDMSAMPECAKLHPDPVTEETVVVGDSGQLKNVVVSIKKQNNLPLEIPKTAAVLDQKACMYEPHVLAMMAGQDLVIKNSDPFLHNVHSLATINDAFNLPMPTASHGVKADPQPRVPETFRVKCDVHPWMSAWIVVLDNPYFSVTGDDGTFDIKNLPDGTYTLQAWQEQYGTQTQTITVKDGKAEANFTYNAVPAPGADGANKKLSQAKPPGGVAVLNCPLCAK